MEVGGLLKGSAHCSPLPEVSSSCKCSLVQEATVGQQISGSTRVPKSAKFQLKNIETAGVTGF